MDFFPDPPDPLTPEELEEPPQPVWSAAPEDLLPGVVPLALILGRSATAVVLLTGISAFPVGVAMTLGVRVRGPLNGRDLNEEVFDGPYRHPMDADWLAGRLKWGWEFSDGRRATNVDPPAWGEGGDHWSDASWRPDRPVLNGQGGGGSRRSVDRDYWLWPLPPAGRLRVVCQWPDQGIEATIHDLDAGPFRDAATRAQPLWKATE
jgi:hypothetical protein